MELKNLWKARITTHDGEYEYSDDIYISGATSEEDALNEARWQARHWYGDEPAVPYQGDPDTWEEDCGYRLIELEGVYKIQTMEDMLKSLYVVEYQTHAVS